MVLGNENCIVTRREMGNEKQQDGTLHSARNTKIYRATGRPKKRWEEEISDFLKAEGAEETNGNKIKNNDTWIKVAKNRERWKAMETE